VSCVSETSEKYKIAPGPSPVEHFELYIWLNLDELTLDRNLALRRTTTLGRSCAGYQDKDNYPDFLAHLHPLAFTVRQSYRIRVCWFLLSRESKDEGWTVWA
jgi:hypothetical protein